MKNNTGYIIGAYPCATHFTRRVKEDGILAATLLILGYPGLEQPCLGTYFTRFGDSEVIAPYTGNWQIVVTAIVEQCVAVAKAAVLD